MLQKQKVWTGCIHVETSHDMPGSGVMHRAGLGGVFSGHTPVLKPWFNIAKPHRHTIFNITDNKTKNMRS